MRILPWNGYNSAISLTFDDGDESQAMIAFPALVNNKKRGTFFLTCSGDKYDAIWKVAKEKGFEIGNHSINHILPVYEKDYDAYEEIIVSKQILEKKYGQQICSYAYPYSFVTDEQIEYLQKSHIGARAGYEDEVIIRLHDDIDWYKIPSFVVMSETTIEDFKDIVEQTCTEKAWVVMMIHAIEGTIEGYEPISKEVFQDFLECIGDNMWVAPFGEVCAYLRAQKIVEKAIKISDYRNVTWDVPEVFGTNVTLKIILDAEESYKIFQNDKQLQATGNGSYDILFNLGAFQIVDKTYNGLTSNS